MQFQGEIWPIEDEPEVVQDVASQDEVGFLNAEGGLYTNRWKCVNDEIDQIKG